MNNTKQITLAWIMYSGDYQDKLLGSSDWVAGDVGTIGNTANGTPYNIDDYVDMDTATGTIGRNLPACLLYPYMGKSVKVFKCPGDKRTGSYPRQGIMPVCRSVSMNCYIGVQKDPSKSNFGLAIWDTAYIGYKRLTDMNRPGPANTIVILDEGPSINDGFFATNMDTYDPNNLPGKRWTDIPATYHNNAGSFSFADGHSEIRRWKDDSTATALLGANCPNNMDLDWIQSKSSAKINNPTR
jgi:prepilin-type processing-associated H-X9-DG protein